MFGAEPIRVSGASQAGLEVDDWFLSIVSIPRRTDRTDFYRF